VANIPVEHVADAHKLNADGFIELFELVPADGSGTVRFKADADATWRSNAYAGLPLLFSGENRSAQGGAPQPRLAIGQQNIDLSAFKPLVYDGGLDAAIVIKIEILLDDMKNNRLIRRQTFYRVRRIESYSRSQINLVLASLSDSLGFSMPFRQYYPPSFPAVQI
jgi:phage-related protein